MGGAPSIRRALWPLGSLTACRSLLALRSLAALRLLLGGFVLFGSAAAFGHSALLQTTPTDGAMLERAPSSIRLIFNEPVAARAMTLITPTGEHVAPAKIESVEDGLRLELPAQKAQGTYALSWRVTSADGHPVGGTLLFSVGAASRQAGAAAPAASGLAPAIWLDRLLLYAGLLAGVGGALFGAAVAPLRPAARAAARKALWLALAALPVALALQGLDVAGAPWSALFQPWGPGPAVWAAALDTSYGTSVVLMAAAVLAALCALRCHSPRPPRGASAAARSQAATSATSGSGANANANAHAGIDPGAHASAHAVTAPIARSRLPAVALAAALLLAAAFAASGHASSAAPAWLARPAVFLHTLAVLCWAGSLLPLIVLLRADNAGAARALMRFSRLIPAVLIVLAASGASLALMQVDKPASLWRTAYGLVLCAKLALVLILLGLAAINRYRLTDAALAGAEQPRRKLRRMIRIEALLVLAILAVVALWRFTPPPRALDALAPPPAIVLHLGAESEAWRLTLRLARDGHGSADLTREDPPEASPETATHPPMHAVPGMQAMPDMQAMHAMPPAPKALTLLLSNPAQHIEAISHDAIARDDGSWHIDALTLPMAGTWDIELTVLVTDFEQTHLHGSTTIPYPARIQE
jgi:copper transport protein